MKLAARILDLLFPKKCPFCQHLLTEPNAPVCPGCQPKLPWLSGGRSRREVDFSSGCFSPLAYRDGVPAAIHRYKFSRARGCCIPFGLLLAQCVQDHLPGRADAVTWAPLSRRRWRQRGFDQSELLARQLAGRLELPILDALVKTRDTPPQSTLEDASARRANALGAYSLRPGIRAEGMRLILVDDVVTSGSTLSECARLLLQAGAEAVWCVTLAQARPEPRKPPDIP